jgi:hypothetical protein
MSETHVIVPVQYGDGKSGSVQIDVIERSIADADGVELNFKFDTGEEVSFFSEIGVFDALKSARQSLEVKGLRLVCFGSDERVYPSPMQESMGLNTLAYRNVLGRQARSDDIVDVFETEESIKCVSVADQKAFHENWLRSL